MSLVLSVACTTEDLPIEVCDPRCAGPNWQTWVLNAVRCEASSVTSVPPSAGPELGERLVMRGTRCARNGSGLVYC